MEPDELDAVTARLWHALASRRGPWRTPMLANVTPDDRADARIVVVREVSAENREAVFFTDRRSRKYPALLANPSVCLAVYDADAGWQARLYGLARLETAQAPLSAWWKSLGERQRAHYGNEEEDAETQDGRENFAAFRVTIERFHCLWLHDDGNEAVEFRWRDDGWEGYFVRP